MNFEKRFADILSVISPEISNSLMKLHVNIKKQVCEIRLRVNCPVALSTYNGVRYLSRLGEAEDHPSNMSHIVSRMDIAQSFKMICGYSIYSFQNEIKNGFITVKNGHRVGIVGTAVMEKDKILTIKDISSLNYRIAREIKGVGKPIVDSLFKADTIQGAIIAGPPASGKTTVLRDIAALLSGGYLGRYIKTAVVDERGEIGAVYLGQPGNDLGVCCDILNGYPKDEGIMIALRCLSPDIIICDEIGTEKEVYAVKSGLNAGVPVITTIHANTLEDILNRPQSMSLISTGAFSDIVLLEGARNPGIIKDYIKVSDVI